MSSREDIIALSIISAIQNSEDPHSDFKDKASNFFSVNFLKFKCVREDLFKSLRKAWNINEDDYKSRSLGPHAEQALQPMGYMGYSGSTFFKTHDEAYLVKGVPRHFEHSFFKEEMLVQYADYMQNGSGSLLARITDLLECSQVSVGSMSGLAPTHHIVMENAKYGEKEADGGKWESLDLKPMSYFYPERDVAGGALSSEATKSRLADDFEESLVLTLDQAEAFHGQLEKDTALLRKCNAVDYSLFVVRMPASDAVLSSNSSPLDGSALRAGIPSADGRYNYRACILDFFWAKHKVHAKAMTGLIKTYNVLDNQGPMSVTTTAEEYRERFLNMCKEIVEVRLEESS